MSSSDDDVVSVASAPTRRISAAALQKALARTPRRRRAPAIGRPAAPSTSHRDAGAAQPEAVDAGARALTPQREHVLADSRAAPRGHAALRLPGRGPLRRAAAATAPPPAATDDEATAYALGLSYHVEALVRAAEHGGGGAQHAAAMEVALEQAVASLSACQQQQAAHLQGVVARQKAGFHERLLDLERRFVAEAQALSEELAATVAADKQAAEAAVARHAQTLAGARCSGRAAAALRRACRRRRRRRRRRLRAPPAACRRGYRRRPPRSPAGAAISRRTSRAARRATTRRRPP